MLPVVLTLLFGAGLVAGLILGLHALSKHVRGSTAPMPARVGTAAIGVAGLSAAGLAGGFLFVSLLAMTTLTALLEHGPVRSIEVLRLDGSALTSHSSELPVDEFERGARLTYQERTGHLDAGYPVHVLVEYRGEVRLDRLHRWLERQTDGKVHLVAASPGEEGLTLLDFGLDVSPRRVARFQEEFETAQPLFDLPHGLRLEVREPH